MKKIILSISLITGAYLLSYAQAGSLDNTFGTEGKVITNYQSYRGNAVAIQSDDKIVVAGTTTISGNKVFALVRFNTNGTIDNTFGTNGVVNTAFLDFNGNGEDVEAVADAIAIQPDGKIVVAGTIFFTSFNPTSLTFGLARYNTNGTLDNSFGTNGQAPFLGSGWCKSLSLQTDGKILAGGYSPELGNLFCVVRWNNNGTIDNTFGINGDGTFYNNLGPSNPAGGIYSINQNGGSVLSQLDGKIVLSGTYKFSGGATRIILARLTSNGSNFDPSFGNGGVVYGDLTDFNLNIGNNDYAYTSVLQSDGKILVGGAVTYTSASESDFVLVRFNSNGTMDNTFGINGVAKADVGSAFEKINSIAIQSNGKIVCAGTTYGNIGDFALVRFNSNGILDNTFNGDGKVITPMGTASDIASGVAIQSDGKIVVAGTAEAVTVGLSDIAIARYIDVSSVGINDVSPSDNFSVFPNPGSGLLTISNMTGKPFKIELRNNIGQLLFTINSTAQNTPLDIQNYASGIYFIMLVDNEQPWYTKLIKK